MKYSFCICDEKDNISILNLLESNPISGSPRLIYTARPSYFKTLRELYTMYKVLGIRDHNKKLVGMVSIGVQERYINQKIIRIGYIDHLRIDKNHRGKGLLTKGFAYLRKQLQDLNIEYCYASIISNNKKAINIFTANIKNHPRFNQIGNVKTLLLFPRKRRIKPKYKITESITPEKIKSFINKEGMKFQFFPKLKSIKNKKCISVLKNRRIVGACILWDQRNIKQMNVESWGTFKKLLIYMYNIYSKLKKYPKLPIKGTLPFAYISYITIPSRDPIILRELIDYIEFKYRADYPFFVLGLDENCPLLDALNEKKYMTYKSQLFSIEWDDKPLLNQKIGKGLIYPEIALL